MQVFPNLPVFSYPSGIYWWRGKVHERWRYNIISRSFVALPFVTTKLDPSGNVYEQTPSRTFTHEQHFALRKLQFPEIAKNSSSIPSGSFLELQLRKS